MDNSASDHIGYTIIALCVPVRLTARVALRRPSVLLSLLLLARPMPGLAQDPNPPANSPSLQPDAVSVTHFGAVGDGRHDDTAAFRAALAKGHPVVVPPTTAFYRITKTLPVSADFRGIGQPRLRREGADGNPGGTLLEVRGPNKRPITIADLVLDGGWNGTASAGEWSHGISIRGASNVTVERCTVLNTYGDNVYVGENEGADSRHILITQTFLDNPRRCNVAVVAGEDVRIASNRMRKTNSYVAAVDVEPNNVPSTTVASVDISHNNVEAPDASFVNLYSPPARSGYPHSVRGVSIRDNHAVARRSVCKARDSGLFREVTISGNYFIATHRSPSACDLVTGAAVGSFGIVTLQLARNRTVRRE